MSAKDPFADYLEPEDTGDLPRDIAYNEGRMKFNSGDELLGLDSANNTPSYAGQGVLSRPTKAHELEDADEAHYRMQKFAETAMRQRKTLAARQAMRRYYGQ